MRVAIDAAIADEAEHGGVAQFIIGLVHGLSSTAHEEAEYVTITDARNPEWLTEYMNGRTQVDQVSNRRSLREKVVAALRPLAKPLYEATVRRVATGLDLEITKGVVGVGHSSVRASLERLNPDVVHFPVQQRFVTTEAKSVYNPHDLQHLHLPEFFSEREIQLRERFYRRGCEESSAICVSSTWVKEDLVDKYGIASEKVYVFPTAAPTEAYQSTDVGAEGEIESKYDLPEEFGFYPAQTWPHKNHRRLLEAIALLRDKASLKVSLVFTGKKNDHYLELKKIVDERGLEDQVRFLGYIPAADVKALYTLASYVVIPTLFEAASLPMFEAWRDSAPVVCSDIGPLADYAGDAAILFDPLNVESIAEAIREIEQSPERRKQLREKGERRSHLFSWRRTARMYSALYRHLGGAEISEEEEEMLRLAVEKPRALFRVEQV